jgi:hypothetical protein
MFDIKGFQNNEPVFIQPGKSIKVTYASNNAEDRFNQYYLDSTKQNWQYLKRDNLPSINQVRESMSAKTNSFSKQNEVADTTLRPVLAAIKNTYQQKMEALPRPAKPKAPQANKAGRPIFQIDRDPQDFPELSTFDNVVFEVGEENKNYSSELHQVTWRDIKIAQGPEKGKNYWLNLSAGPRKVSLIVYPVFVGANYDKALALYNSKLNEYNQAQNKRLAEEKRLIAEMEMKQAAYLQAEKEKALAIEKQRQASLAAQKELRQNALSTQFNQLNSQTKTYRLFEVMSFGIYNSDCAKPLPEENITKPVFVSTNNQQVMMPDAVYLVNKSNNTVIGLSPADGFTFGYGNSSTYMLCLFQKNEVFVCDPDLFNSAVNSDKHQFLVKSITAASANLQDFKKALNL